MKHLFFIILFAGISTCAISQDFEGGAFVGLTANQIDGDAYSGYKKVGLQGGGWVRRMFTYTVGGQMELRYIQKGALHTPTANDPVYHKTTLHFIDIPLMAQYHYNQEVILELGISPDILINAKQEDENGAIPIQDPPYNRLSMSAIVGVGYRFFEVMQVHFRFNYSIVPIRPHPSGQTYQLNKGHYSNSLTIALYYEIGNN
jgi:hypothetical protein